jgi:hypothetical protein
MEAAQTVHRQSWRAGTPRPGSRSVPEETAVAVTYNGGAYAVMMTTPQDLEDFALGFSLSEGVVNSAADIDSLDIVHLNDGVNCGYGSVSREPIACGSGGGAWRDRPGVACAASNRSRKRCVRPPPLVMAGNFRHNTSWLPWRVCHRVKNSTSRRGPSTRRLF